MIDVLHIAIMRKPTKHSTVRNAVDNSVGVLNIDDCRVHFVSEADESESKEKNRHADFGTPAGTNTVYGDYSMVPKRNYSPPGRFPTNVILDGSNVVKHEFPITHGHGSSRHSGSSKGMFNWGTANRIQAGGESGSASRFFKECPDD